MDNITIKELEHERDCLVIALTDYEGCLEKVKGKETCNICLVPSGKTGVYGHIDSKYIVEGMMERIAKKELKILKLSKIIALSKIRGSIHPEHLKEIKEIL